MNSLTKLKQQEMEQEVIAIYEKVAEASPDASWHNKLLQVSVQTGMTTNGIDKLLARNGITNPKKQQQ